MSIKLRTKHKSKVISLAVAMVAFAHSAHAQLAPQPDPTYAPCPAHQMGSPIDIEGTDPVRTYPLNTYYNLSPLLPDLSGNGIMLSYPQGSELRVGQKRFSLQDIYIKTPSEHTVVGRRYPMELQLVHRHAKYGTAVVSVLVANGQTNPAAEEVWPYMPKADGSQTDASNIRYNIRDFLPQDLSYYRYQGTLTHGGCDTGTAWYVLKAPIQMSAEQISAIMDVQGRNAANLQPRNFRIILDGAQ